MKKQEQYQKEEKYEEVDKVAYEMWLFRLFSFLEYNPDVKDDLLKITSITYTQKRSARPGRPSYPGGYCWGDDKRVYPRWSKPKPTR